MADMRTQLNIKIDSKTHWLATLEARSLGMTLAEFVEHWIAYGITKEGRDADEPRVNEPSGPRHLLRESLWDDDPGTRLFNLARAHEDLLNGPQRALWSKISSLAARDKKTLNLKNFIGYYNGLHAKGRK